jgi:hypothetical protein
LIISGSGGFIAVHGNAANAGINPENLQETEIFYKQQVFGSMANILPK